MNILVIDDLKNIKENPGEFVKYARTYNDGIKQLKNKKWNLLYLDHDLGDDKTGYDIINWLDQNKEFLPDEIKCISMNPVGRDKINKVIKKLYEPI